MRSCSRSARFPLPLCGLLPFGDLQGVSALHSLLLDYSSQPVREWGEDQVLRYQPPSTYPRRPWPWWSLA